MFELNFKWAWTEYGYTGSLACHHFPESGFKLKLFPSDSDKESACQAGDVGLSLGWEAPLEKEIATHSSILAWEIPWTEEPSGLLSMGLQSVGHNLATEQKQCTFYLCIYSPPCSQRI